MPVTNPDLNPGIASGGIPVVPQIPTIPGDNTPIIPTVPSMPGNIPVAPSIPGMASPNEVFSGVMPGSPNI